ncbi:MAG: DinB family protein [Chloroflexota bacterium]|nr:DinB family protein [Chloroflexota bacterium]
MTTPVRQFLIQPPAGYEPEIGRWIAALDDTRQRTLQAVAGLPTAALDTAGPVGSNTIGTLLYHIAGAEAMWLYRRILQQPMPAEIVALFPRPRDEARILSQLPGETLDSHLHRLGRVSAQLRVTCQAMSVAEFRRVRSQDDPLGPLEFSVEGALQQLMQHEAEHRGHIQLIREGLA